MVSGNISFLGREQVAARAPTPCELAVASPQHLAPLLVCHHHFVDVSYEDTDATGAVYHPNYLRFLDRARSQLLGAKLLRFIQEHQGLSFLIHKAALDFKRMASFGDRLRVDTRLRLSTPHKLEFVHHIVQDGPDTLVAIAEVRVVCVDRRGRPRPVPLAKILDSIHPSPNSM